MSGSLAVGEESRCVESVQRALLLDDFQGLIVGHVERYRLASAAKVVTLHVLLLLRRGKFGAVFPLGGLGSEAIWRQLLVFLPAGNVF